MEEDVEIVQLLETNESLLIEAAKSIDNDIHLENDEIVQMSKSAISLHNSNTISDINMCIEEPADILENSGNSLALSQTKSPGSSNFSNDSKHNFIYGEEIQELLDDQMVTCLAKEPSRLLLPLYSVDSDDESSLSGNDYDETDRSNRNGVMGNYDPKLLDSTQTRTGNKSKQSQKETLIKLGPIQRMILEKDRLLTMLEIKLQEELHENEEKQRKIRNNIIQLTNDNNKIREPNFKRCFFKKFGMPYFEDINGFTPMPNDDYKRKLEKGELVVTKIPKVRYWIKTHKEMLQEAIKQTIIAEQSDKLKKEIVKLRELLKFAKIDEDELVKQITEFQTKLRCLKATPYSELVSKEKWDREYDWMKYSATVFNGLHSPEECRRFWHVYLNPCINKASWEVAEDMKLIKIAEEMHFQDWDEIAKRLNTNRTAYQCLVHFQTRLHTKHGFSSGKWTKEEDKKLLSVINASKIGDFIPWTKVSTHVGSRTHSQVYNRWSNCLNPKLVKGRFTKEEDLLIVSGIEVFGVNFKEMASLMSNRTPTQIRERYERHLLTKTAKVGAWSLEEDEKLLNLIQKHGEQNWVAISDEMKTRTRTQVRQRYNFIKLMMKTKPGWTVVKAKRKGINNTSKIRNLTEKNVERVKKEIDKVDRFFNLSQLEKDTFRIEKLKELRDQIVMKRFDLKRRQKIFSDSSQINNLLLEYFKSSQRNPPIRPSKIDHHACNVYMNEMLLMTKYFGQDLKLPETEDEIKNNFNLSKNLQYFLCEKLKTADGMKNLKESSSSNSIINCGSSVDYEQPETEHDIIMHNSWHTPLFDVTRLNFSEMFKRAVFDYTNGMHKDIWYTRKNRSSTHWSTFPGVVAEFDQSPTQQPFHLPPNHLTTVGFRSLLLSRYRLKQDASTKESAEKSKEIENEETTTKFQIDVDLNHRLLDQFQETMITLFTWPKVLAVTSIGSTQVTQVSTARATQIGGESNQSINISSLMNNMTPEPTDVIFEASKENVRKSKVRQTMQEQSEDLKRKLVEIRRGITCKSKVNIDHLLKKVKVEPSINKKRMRNNMMVSVRRRNKTLIDTMSSTSLHQTKQKLFCKVPKNQISSQLSEKTQVNSNLHEDNSKLPLYQQDQCISIRDRNKTAITYRGARKNKTGEVLSHDQLHEVTNQKNPLKDMEIASTGVPESYSNEIDENENLDRNIPINQPHSDEVESCLEIVQEKCVSVSKTASKCTEEKGSCEATTVLKQSSKRAKKPAKIKSDKNNESVTKLEAKGIREQSGSNLPTNLSDSCKRKSRLGTIPQDLAPVHKKTNTNLKRRRSSSKEVAVKSLKQLRKRTETQDALEPIGKKSRCHL